MPKNGIDNMYPYGRHSPGNCTEDPDRQLIQSAG